MEVFRWMTPLLGALVLLFIIAPLAAMILQTSPVQVFDTFKDQEVTSSIWLTVRTSLFATLLFSLSAIPLAWLLARKSFPGKKLVTGLIDLPVVIPHSAAGIAVLGLISRDTALGQLASAAGFDLVGNPVGISLAMAFVSVPFLINAARDGFLAVPERLEKAALTLGASQSRIFFTISLPLAWRSILSGLIMMFARGMSEFGAVIMVAYHPMITPILIFERFNSFGLKYARPVAVTFILVTLALFIVLRFLSGDPRDKNKSNG